jgi:hypothetical protein
MTARIKGPNIVIKKQITISEITPKMSILEREDLSKLIAAPHCQRYQSHRIYLSTIKHDPGEREGPGGFHWLFSSFHYEGMLRFGAVHAIINEPPSLLIIFFRVKNLSCCFVFFHPINLGKCNSITNQ